MRIAALTDHPNTPSSRFRIRTHIAGLRDKGVIVEDLARKFSTQSAGKYLPELRIRDSLTKSSLALTYEILNTAHSLFRAVNTRGFDATWISRELVVGYPTFEFLLNRPIFYDIDDAVFLNKLSSIGINRIIKRSTAVFAGNSYLAEYCLQYNSNVHVIPTAVDTEKFKPAEPKVIAKEFKVGWSGTSSSFKFFLPLQRELAKFCRDNPSVRLKFFSDRYPVELKEITEYVDFEPWSFKSEAHQIQTLDVGLMPIEDSEWSRGKCAYKFLLYAAAGVPTICSPVGMNAEVLNLGRVGLGAKSPNQWRECLEFMLKNRDFLTNLFPDCRRVVCENYSLDVVQAKILQIFKY